MKMCRNSASCRGWRCCLQPGWAWVWCFRRGRAVDALFSGHYGKHAGTQAAAGIAAHGVPVQRSTLGRSATVRLHWLWLIFEFPLAMQQLALRLCFYPCWKKKISGMYLATPLILAWRCLPLFRHHHHIGSGLCNWAPDCGNGADCRNSFSVQGWIIAAVMSSPSFRQYPRGGVACWASWTWASCVFAAVFVLWWALLFTCCRHSATNIGTSKTGAPSFKTYAYEREHKPWLQLTVLYWAWWCSWRRLCGLFIARISKGRTIPRVYSGFCFILACSAFCITVSAHGDLAEWRGCGGMLERWPPLRKRCLNSLITSLARIDEHRQLAGHFLFFVTSADSGIYVLNNITSRQGLSAPRWQAVMWACWCLPLPFCWCQRARQPAV